MAACIAAVSNGNIVDLSDKSFSVKP